MVNLLRNLRPFKNYNFKIQWEIHFLIFFYILAESPQKKIRIEIWTFSFKIFRINFGLQEVVKREICKYAYGLSFLKRLTMGVLEFLVHIL